MDTTTDSFDISGTVDATELGAAACWRGEKRCGTKLGRRVGAGRIWLRGLRWRSARCCLRLRNNDLRPGPRLLAASVSDGSGGEDRLWINGLGVPGSLGRKDDSGCRPNSGSFCQGRQDRADHCRCSGDIVRRSRSVGRGLLRSNIEFNVSLVGKWIPIAVVSEKEDLIFTRRHLIFSDRAC